ncbi:mitotic spindle assembly checkpoint protein MAD1 [Phlebotomus argentipes]|uniref:mitotic spindle assembly checkpoint protein MAD1 n=1 Tax=Phlebotomus argentipes TaxID=94469 RepID=UPI0028931D4F|nr:mitotic spindle assembly checkpoint protein MAD1 [Phlebotomus argentipes]
MRRDLSFSVNAAHQRRCCRCIDLLIECQEIHKRRQEVFIVWHFWAKYPPLITSGRRGGTASDKLRGLCRVWRWSGDSGTRNRAFIAMEEIKSNIDKIFDQLLETNPFPIPKRLSFDSLGDSLDEKRPSKRKIPSGDSNLDKRRRDESPNSSVGSTNNSIVPPMSPWEMRLMKADLITANANINQLQSELEQQQLQKRNMEKDFASKIDGLKDQVAYFKNKSHEVEKHLGVVRKRESNAKQDLVSARNEKKADRLRYEETIHSLQKKLMSVEDNFRKASNEYNNDVSDLNRQLSEVMHNLTSVEEENSRLFELNETLQGKVGKLKELEAALEEEKQKNQSASMKIKELEYEISGYGEWKEMSTSSLARLSQMADLEKEVVLLRTKSKNLRDAIGNKLLLEEQVNDLKSRLERSERNNLDAIALKIQAEDLEKELNTWKAIAVDHCPQSIPATPPNLRRRIEEILQKDVILVNERNKSKTERNSLEAQSHEVRGQNDALLKANQELKGSLEKYQKNVLRLQKRMQLLVKERDCYKQLIENYEKDLTISGPSGAMTATPENQLRLRVEMLEKTLAGYKEMCANLEKDLQTARAFPDANVGVTSSHEHLRRELNEARMENERMRRRRDELEMELEHRSLKGDFNADKYQVVHMEGNPAQVAHESHLEEVEKLQAEIERLKRKIRKLEEDHENMTMRLNESNITLNIKEINQLRSQVASLEAKNQHLKEAYKVANQEFREVCYMLFGYRVDRTGSTNYRISSMYAENEDDFLSFRLKESGALDMLETEYSMSLREMMRTHLGTHNSLPTFLSALTMDLFNRTTISV